ncbi:MAG: MFS transporter [Desulfobacterales bacterium]|nr:MFS transporter [Desulfobacterales bacterium]
MMEGADKKRAWLGWCLYDWANSGFATICLAAVLPVYFLSLVPEGGAIISLPGFSFTKPAAALWGYAVSCSMLIVALGAPWLGAMADRRGNHRWFLFLFCLLGSVATALLATAGHGGYLLAAGLFIVANISFAGGNVFYNAYLPALADQGEMDRLSARGFATGYVGGGLALLLVFGIILKFKFFGLVDQGQATRFGFLLTGLWWLFFGLPAIRLLPAGATDRPAGRYSGTAGYLKTFAEIAARRDLLLFLIAFLFYNDGIQTIIVVASIFAREELRMSQGAILGCYLMIQFVAMPGTLLFGRLAERVGAKRTIHIALVLFVAVTGYAYFMARPWEFWLLGFGVALILGGSQAVSRSLFSSLLPADKGAEFFGFYAITAKFASIMGPLLFALIVDLTGSVRLSILALTIFFIIGMILLAGVDVERGRAQARAG